MNSLGLIYLKYRASYYTNKGNSSLTSLVACFILGKVYCRTYWRWYACGLVTAAKGITCQAPNLNYFYSAFYYVLSLKDSS